MAVGAVKSVRVLFAGAYLYLCKTAIIFAAAVMAAGIY